MKNNKQDLYIFIIMIALIGLTIGYAALNSTLNINGKSSISKNTWDVHFDNVVVKEGSVEAVKIPAITDKTTVDFEVALNMPGDFYEFNVDVVNDGTIDAMIESIEKTPVLTEAQAKYLSYTINYENGEQIATKQLVKKEEFVRLKVRVELRTDIVPSDLPEVGDVLYLSFTTNYQQADNSGVTVNNNGIISNLVSANGDINEIGTIVTIGDQQFYTIGTEGDNVKLLAMYNLYVGGSYDTTTRTLNAYGSEATGKQNEYMLGWSSKDNSFNGVTAFSFDTTTYEGSLVEAYVNAYKELLEGEEYGVSVVEVRLIYREELTDSETFACKENDSCSDRYPWIYSTSYWTGESALAYDGMYIDRDGSFGSNFFSNDSYFGVRPVIVISKDYF